MLDRLTREPVLVTTLVGAVLVLLIQFGVPISDGQADAVTAVVVAFLAFVARSKVSPVE
ncbi:MAG TPA: hypothetical protein VFK52_09205 [Nocardioidaceae bacterium]|nr:hypothetical protein [Nocardioidaceae bacterium]